MFMNLNMNAILTVLNFFMTVLQTKPNSNMKLNISEKLKCTGICFYQKREISSLIKHLLNANC